MAGNKEIKNRIVLEGEKEYNQAIKEAQRNLRTLKSELKAETAELGRNATEQQKAEAKTKSLKAQIAEQEKIVKTLREGLEQVKKEYGDNADEVAKWETKLNNARTTLANMKNDLDGVGNGMKGVQQNAAQGTVATKAFADSLGKISETGNAVASAIESIFSGIVSTVTGAVEALWDQIMETSARANRFTDLASYYGSSAQEIQMWSRSIQAAGGDFEKFLAVVNRLSFGGKEKNITESLGISKENYQDDIKYTLAVLDELQKKREELGQGWYDSFMAEMFGQRKSADVSWFLANAYGHENANGDWVNGWRDNPERFNGDQGGIGMSSEDLSTMNDVYIQVQNIQSTWQAFVDSFTTKHFGKLALDLTGNAQRILEDLIKFLDSGDDADLAQLEKDIEEFFERIKKALENAAGKLDEAGKKLQESDNGIVRLIGKAMSDLAAALQWISEEDNIDKVIKGLEALAAVWAAGKIASMVGSVAEFAANLRTIRLFSTMTTATGAASSAGGIVSSLGSTIASALAGVTLAVSIAALAVPVASLLKSLITEGKFPDWLPDPNKTTGETVAPNASPETQEAITELLDQPAPKNVSAKDALHWGVSRLLGDREAGGTEQETDPLANAPVVQVETGAGPSRPRIGIDATEAQQAAAEAFWDAVRSGDSEEFDRTWDAMEEAFAGNEAAFERLDGMLDRLIEEWGAQQNYTDYNPTQWMDIPSTWWQQPAGGDTGNNGVTSRDLEGFRGMPAGVENAAERGVTKGIRGLRVEIDGQAAGRILAPYVSQEIARSIQ